MNSEKRVWKTKDTLIESMGLLLTSIFFASLLVFYFEAHFSGSLLFLIFVPFMFSIAIPFICLLSTIYVFAVPGCALIAIPFWATFIVLFFVLEEMKEQGLAHLTKWKVSLFVILLIIEWVYWFAVLREQIDQISRSF